MSWTCTDLGMFFKLTFNNAKMFGLGDRNIISSSWKPIQVKGKTPPWQKNKCVCMCVWVCVWQRRLKGLLGTGGLEWYEIKTSWLQKTEREREREKRQITCIRAHKHTKSLSWSFIHHDLILRWDRASDQSKPAVLIALTQHNPSAVKHFFMSLTSHQLTSSVRLSEEWQIR